MKVKKLEAPQLFTSTLSNGRHESHPFTQQPSDNQFPVVKPTGTKDSPSELFSRFTADIIKTDAIFTR